MQAEAVLSAPAVKELALSIRQPWAWLIIHAGKDVENRDWATGVRGRVLIHAGKTMTRADYGACALFCSSFLESIIPDGVEFPSFEELKAQCGGIVGAMNITDCVAESKSPWFYGRYGFVIGSAMSLPFRSCNGALGFFRV